MQYSVPQFVDVEDKIIGPLTLKQFLILLGGGLLEFFYWSIFKVSAGFFIATLPTAGIFIALAFGKFNGRPLMSNIIEVAKYFLAAKHRVFRRSADAESVLAVHEKAPTEKAGITQEMNTERESRLKRLAYLLDQKTAEEERLVHSGKMPGQWMNQI